MTSIWIGFSLFIIGSCGALFCHYEKENDTEKRITILETKVAILLQERAEAKK